ncbi:MAG TPA: sulfatase, partial [Pirellula sp.]|nr:sulfatase [Pirellula sp.]
PYQLTNLAGDVAHALALKSLRERLDRWILETKDHGSESDAMYDSDMKVYLGKGNPEVEKNIAQMKRWAKESR